MSIQQPELDARQVSFHEQTWLERLNTLLSHDLDFHGENSGHASHYIHPFPAKFPPQLPQKFIEWLTSPGDTVLDPMMGSGTTVLEAYLSSRRGVGFDIDPLALKLTKAKVTPLNPLLFGQVGKEILDQAKFSIRMRENELIAQLNNNWDVSTREFINYWFTLESQLQLLALISSINQIENSILRNFFELIFSTIIITKTGGVSLALDLAHTRPHRAKVVYGINGEVVSRNTTSANSLTSKTYHSKKLRSPFKEFEKRIEQNLNGLKISNPEGIQPYLEGLFEPLPKRFKPIIAWGNAQNLSIANNSIDLIVTSPPYASNAIDYMRAHKYSLVWMGYSIDELKQIRKEYIGAEALTGFIFEVLPKKTSNIVDSITEKDKQKGRVLKRYYSEMTRSLREMYRILKPGKAAIVVVGSSLMRGIDTETNTCLAEIGQSIGFKISGIGERNLDRDRRMMPAGNKINLNSQRWNRRLSESC